MTFVLATHNKGKLRELRELLSPFGHELLSLDDMGITDAPEEDGDTFEANALIKAAACCKATGLPSIADDSGLCVDALDGAPGVYSARYGDSDSARIDRLLEALRGVENRKARFVCAAACVFPPESEVEKLCAEGVCDGIILESRRGNGGFGFDPVFFVPQFGRTFAELSEDEKNKTSHRGSAMRKLAEIIARIR